MRFDRGRPEFLSRLVILSGAALFALAMPACAGSPTPRPALVPPAESSLLPTPHLPPDPAPPDTSEIGPTTKETATERFYLKPLHSIIKHHREVGTHIDGPRCPMYPSCGAYADRIIREGGFYGLILFIDRLFYREFGRLGDRYMVAPRSLSTSPRYYDPVSDALPDDTRGGAHRPSFFREDFSN